jgi:uncharacterized protein YecT (DUF1311 family)
MRCVAVGILFAVVGCIASTDQNSEAYTKCIDKAITQTAMHVCANEELQRVDVELNRVYLKLLSATRDQPDATEKIRASQRAWITYRDAYIEAMYSEEDKQAAYGSVFPMNVEILRAKLTRQQIAALGDLLTQYKRSRQ